MPRLALALLLLPLAASCASVPSSSAADAATIHELIRKWDAAARGKDATEFATIYADDALVLLANMPDLRGLPAIREGIAGMMQDPNFRLTFTADDVVVSRSGDMAYETGKYSMAMSGPDGRAVVEHGGYVVVWRKQADGRWKVVVDAPVSDAPAAPAGR